MKAKMSDALDRLMQVKKTPKKIANVFTNDCMRVGVIMAREERIGLSKHIILCFESVRGNRPAFMGWFDDEERLKARIKSRYPQSFITSNIEFDDLLDSLERVITLNQ
jgi:hypothetical protein